MNRRDLLKSLSAIPFVGLLFGKTARDAEPAERKPTTLVHCWPMDKIVDISWEIVTVTIDGVPQAFHLCRATHEDCKSPRFVLRYPLVGDRHDRWVRVGWRSDELTEEIKKELYTWGICYKEIRSLMSAYFDMLSRRTEPTFFGDYIMFPGSTQQQEVFATTFIKTGDFQKAAKSSGYRIV